MVVPADPERERSVARFAHDICNPLTLAAGYVSLLAEEISETDIQPPSRKRDWIHYLYLIESGVYRGAEIARSWLDESHGASAAPKRPLCIAEMVREVVQTAELWARNKGVRLQAFISSEPVRVVGSRLQLQRAVENAVINAIEAMHGESGRVNVRVTCQEEWAVVEVEDNGCGMSPDIQSRVCEPFFTHGKLEGTGLGMCNIRHIIFEHGGWLGLSSREGVGTTLALVLPRAEA